MKEGRKVAKEAEGRKVAKEGRKEGGKGSEGK